MSIQRNDITIQISSNGDVYAAQGTPAFDALPGDEVALECDLFFSQTRHRVAALLQDGRMEIMTPTKATEVGAVDTLNCDIRGIHCTGRPAYLGTIAPRCVYCGEHADDSTVPDSDDDDAWEAIAKEHDAECEWVRTRAHSL